MVRLYLDSEENKISTESIFDTENNGMDYVLIQNGGAVLQMKSKQIM